MSLGGGTGTGKEICGDYEKGSCEYLGLCITPHIIFTSACTDGNHEECIYYPLKKIIEEANKK